MKNYLECTQAEFDAAMAKKDADLNTITNQELYILKTKYAAEVNSIRGDTIYARSILSESARRFKMYDDEMRARMIGGKPWVL